MIILETNFMKTLLYHSTHLYKAILSAKESRCESIIKLLLKMPLKKQIVDTKQRNISSFFHKSVKRENESAINEIPCKIQKTGDNDPPTSPLSPEQRRRMEEKKVEAKKKLQDKLTCSMNIGSTWKEALKGEFTKDYYIKLQKFVASQRAKATIYPPEHDVFSWTRFCAINNIKVVIIGQDPYHGPKQAHGLCFSVQVGVAVPPSLVNMYKELESDISGFQRPKHGHLVGWAKQGVLLLNAVLTVEASKANSHKEMGWEKFTDATIKWINNNLEGVVFILWGGYAQKKGNFINKKKHHVITGRHPSPLSAHRGFFGSKPFSNCNKYLRERGKPEIDWNYLPESI